MQKDITLCFDTEPKFQTKTFICLFFSLLNNNKKMLKLEKRSRQNNMLENTCQEMNRSLSSLQKGKRALLKIGHLKKPSPWKRFEKNITYIVNRHRSSEVVYRTVPLVFCCLLA